MRLLCAASCDLAIEAGITLERSYPRARVLVTQPPFRDIGKRKRFLHSGKQKPRARRGFASNTVAQRGLLSPPMRGQVLNLDLSAGATGDGYNIGFPHPQFNHKPSPHLTHCRTRSRVASSKTLTSYTLWPESHPEKSKRRRWNATVRTISPLTHIVGLP